MDFFFFDTYYIVPAGWVAVAATLPLAIIIAPIFFLLIRRNRQDPRD